MILDQDEPKNNNKRSKMCDLWLAYSGPSLIWAEIRRYFVWSQIAKIVFSIGRMLLHDSYIKLNVTTAVKAQNNWASTTFPSQDTKILLGTYPHKGNLENKPLRV